MADTKLQPGAPDTFECAMCHGVFDKSWSDEEARAEFEKRFPGAEFNEDMLEVICDDCDKLFQAQLAPLGLAGRDLSQMKITWKDMDGAHERRARRMVGTLKANVAIVNDTDPATPSSTTEGA